MAVVCNRCGRQYDVTLFQFGRTVTCECGAALGRGAEITLGAMEAAARAVGVEFLVPVGEENLLVYIVRHGRTVWNKSGRLQGHSEVELSEEGRAEARLAAAALESVPFEAAYSSDLSRAVETAELILAKRAVPLVTTESLREEDYGEWTGRTCAEIARLWPGECAERQRDRINSRPPGGESMGELRRRVTARMDEIAAAHRRGNVLVVTHGGPAFVFLSNVLAPGGALGGGMTIENCSISIAAHTPFGWKVKTLNDTCHLGNARLDTPGRQG